MVLVVLVVVEGMVVAVPVLVEDVLQAERDMFIQPRNTEVLAASMSVQRKCNKSLLLLRTAEAG